MLAWGSSHERFASPPETETRALLEKQFKKKEVIKLAGGDVEFVDVRPEAQKDEVPVMFAAGWGSTADALEDNIVNLAEKGRRVLSVNSRHGVAPEKEMADLPNAELRKIAAIEAVLKDKAIEKVDAIAHSEAGIFMILAAKFNPEKFRNIILVNPAGMIGEDTRSRLAAGFSANLVEEFMRTLKDPKRIQPMLKLSGEVGKSIVADPASAFRETLAISEADIADILKELHEKGIGLSVIQGADDSIFPLAKMEEKLKGFDPQRSAMNPLHGVNEAPPPFVDEFLTVNGTHNELYMDPEKYSALFDGILESLEVKHRRGLNHRVA